MTGTGRDARPTSAVSGGGGQDGGAVRGAPDGRGSTPGPPSRGTRETRGTGDGWDAVVVGGGVAGLSAAWELTRAGLRPLVVEARGYTGGLVADAEVAGVRLELGAEGFAARGQSSPLSVASAAARLGLSTVPPRGGARLFLPPGASSGWELRPFPARAILGIPADPGAEDVVGAIGAQAARRAARDRVLPASVGTSPGDPGDLASFVRARMGEEVLDRLVRPVVAGIHSADPGVLAADTVAPGLREATARLGSLGAAVEEMVGRRRASGQRGGDATVEGGLSRLTDALRQAVEAAGGQVLTRTGAQWLRQAAPGAWELEVAATTRGPSPSDEPVAAEPGRVLRTPRVLLACSATAALRLLEGAPGVGTDVTVPQGSSIARLLLVVRAPGLGSRPVGSGLLVAPPSPGQPTPCPVRAKALSHLSVKWPWVGHQLRQRHGEGVHALRLSYGRPGQPRPEVGLASALDDVATLTGVRVPPHAVVDHVLARWEGTLPPFTPGYRQRVARLEEEVADLEGLAVTGAWVAGTGIASVVPHARAAALSLLPGTGPQAARA